MRRRVQRQKQFHNKAARRKKLADPATRLAHFKKKQQPAASVVLLDHTPKQAAESLHQSGPLITPTPSLKELSEKEHALYR